MVRPSDFGWNAETARDNEFQHRPDISTAETLREAALNEFATAVQSLQDAHVKVLVLEKNPSLGPAPDAVFPNNWCSVWPDGRLFTYPMRTSNRQLEVRPREVQSLLVSAGKIVTINRVQAAPGLSLEGTGALVFDHVNARVYAARSERCDAGLAQKHARALAYEFLLFDTRSSSGRAFYHTNVILSVGENFAVIASYALSNPAEREAVLASLQRDKSLVIELTPEQTEQHFCANMLQLATTTGEHIIALSQRAYDGLSETQRAQLSEHGRLLPLTVTQIENVGGGSVRCMLAEVF